MCIPLQRISNSRDFVKYISEKMSLLDYLKKSIPNQRISSSRDFVKHISEKMSLLDYLKKRINCSKLLLRGKIKKVLSRAHMCSLEQRARNAHDPNEQTLHSSYAFGCNILMI